MDPISDLAHEFRSSFSHLYVSVNESLGELTLKTSREQIVPLLFALRDDVRFRFVCLLDICGVDWPERRERFEVVYHLLSPSLNQRVRLKLNTDEQTPVPSACAVFPAADWYEREAWDMYGILFEGHPDLRRILTDYGFEGHPCEKTFPSPDMSRFAMTITKSALSMSR